MYDAKNVEFKFSRLRRHLNQREIKTVRYSGDSLYPVVDIAEFDCSTTYYQVMYNDIWMAEWSKARRNECLVIVVVGGSNLGMRI